MTTKRVPDEASTTESAQEVHEQMLASSNVALYLGLICAQMLRTNKVVTLFINTRGVVEVAPQGELELDLLPEHTALSTLIAKGYNDQQLEAYLKGREARNLNRIAQEALSVPALKLDQGNKEEG